VTATATTKGSAATALSVGTSRSVWTARTTITPSGTCLPRWATTALSRMGGRTANGAARGPHFVHVAVADAEAFEAFQMSKLIGLPAVARAVSHQTMERLKG
jgi:hypothetical protein